MSTSLDANRIIARIDAVIHELEALRQQLIAPASPSTSDLTDLLFGALGRGTWEEYDLNLDWARFGA